MDERASNVIIFRNHAHSNMPFDYVRARARRYTGCQRNQRPPHVEEGEQYKFIFIIIPTKSFNSSFYEFHCYTFNLLVVPVVARDQVGERATGRTAAYDIT